MLGNDKRLYAAFKAKDARFDGRFFVGISSTGIYCRPVCRAKQPKPENCAFFGSAAEAEQAGYRPYLLCRPELAPGTSITDASATLARRAAAMLDQNSDSGQSLDELAGRLGCTSRHLRRVFMAEYNVPPVRYLQTRRLLLAKNLLTDTNLSVLEIAMAAGFGSLRRFNDLFKKYYKFPPSALRKERAGKKHESGGITLALGYRPPYQWRQLLDFLAGRAITGVELVENDAYMRTVCLTAADGKQVCGWIRVGHTPQRNTLSVTMCENLLPVLPQVLERVRHLFDVDCDPHAVYDTLRAMNDARPGLCVLGTRLPGCFDAFEMSMRAVLGQQITVKAAGTLAGRIARAYGTPMQTGIAGLSLAFPSPQKVLTLRGPIENHLGPLGVTAARSRTIHALARAFAQEEIDFGLCGNPVEEIKKLTAIPGIGSWTAHYIAMRAMGWPDAFLETDAGVKKALGFRAPKELLEMAEAWRPWRSYATVNLWNTL